MQYNPPEGNVSQWVNNINDSLDAPPHVGYMPDGHYQMDPYNPDPYGRKEERRASFMGSTFGSKASKSQSMTSLTSGGQRHHSRKESMPASFGGGGRLITPGEGGMGGSPFDAMLKGGEGLGSRRGSQISMQSDRSMSMKW